MQEGGNDRTNSAQRQLPFDLSQEIRDDGIKINPETNPSYGCVPLAIEKVQVMLLDVRAMQIFTV